MGIHVIPGLNVYKFQIVTNPPQFQFVMLINLINEQTDSQFQFVMIINLICKLSPSFQIPCDNTYVY